MLEEVAREKQSLRTKAQQQVQQAVQAAKTEWLKAARGNDGNVSLVHTFFYCFIKEARFFDHFFLQNRFQV